MTGSRYQLRAWRAAIAVAGVGCAVAGGAIWVWGTSPQVTPLVELAALDHEGLSGQVGVSVVPREIINRNGLDFATKFTGSIRDGTSLRELREALLARGRGGLAAMQAERDQLGLGDLSMAAGASRTWRHRLRSGAIFLYEGRLDEAAAAFRDALAMGRSLKKPSPWQSDMNLLLGIVALRQGEVDNCIACVGPSSCIFPIAAQAVHTNQAGSREAVERFTAYLEKTPNNLHVTWLLNLAYMTLGEYPQKVPAQYLLPLDHLHSKIDVGRFDNVALSVGLTSRGPNLAGGSVFDDFTGDGLPDLLTTSLDADRGASLYVNLAGKKFEDRSKAAGLDDQVYALNVTHADFDNDGDLDVLLLRGGWEMAMRLSLLRNDGHGVFEDVTVASGLAEPIATESAAWGDYDNDGLLDLFVCGEYAELLGTPPQPCNHCRLYRNRGDGTFVDVTAAAGVTNERWAKGCAWGDYDGDGWLDLCVSNMGGNCRLYHNQRDGTFRDAAEQLDVTGPDTSFACWFWDYNNDGRLDIYLNDYSLNFHSVLAGFLGTSRGSSRPRLYQNLGRDEAGPNLPHRGFRDVTREVGLAIPMCPMGCNFGDIDNDGYLDLYLGTGHMSYAGIVPNVMFKNVAGQRFENITVSSGTGHLQKGHGVSLADWDNDGDLDLFVENGGGVPGDGSYNSLFQNPGHGRHWLKVKLVGTITNRAALGARIKAVIKGSDGATRSIYRTVGNNSSFGGNSLVELVGLSDAKSVAELEVAWPTSRTTQTFRDVAADQMIEITEGASSFKVVPQKRLQVPRGEEVSNPKGG
jgi:hypothetical protein